MERTDELKLILLLLLVAVAQTAGAKVAVSDAPTLEALIDAHKQIKKSELQMVALGTTYAGEENLTKTYTRKFKNVRDTLRKRTNDGFSYLRLATSLANTGAAIAETLINYKDFTVNTFNCAKKKPYMLAYYYDANYRIKKEVETVEKKLAAFAGVSFNLLKATMTEKYILLANIDYAILKIKKIIRMANYRIKAEARGHFSVLSILEISELDFVNDIARDCIKEWDTDEQTKKEVEKLI